MKILFMGSPELAIPSLRTVLKAGRIVGVVTQPPKVRGRGRKITPSPVSQEAAVSGLKVLTPGTLRTPEVEATLQELEPDIAVVVAYGKILPPNILNIPRLGCVNVHASLLPELRGAAPIQWAIARGFGRTGVTLMQMDEGMDTGPILLQESTSIGDTETSGELGRRLARLGADLLRRGLPLLERGELSPVPQDDSLATYAPLLTKEDGLIDWNMTAREIASRVRGFSPWPGTYTERRGKRLLVTSASTLDSKASLPPGTVITADQGGIQVACGGGILNILTLKPEGKREMNVKEFLSGYELKVGESLGE